MPRSVAFKPLLQKLKGYKYVDEMNELKYGAHIRWIPIENPETIATAIRIGNPASWTGAVAAQAESNGIIDLVTDDEITEAQIKLARLDGVFCEPASAASIAGVKKMLKTTEFTSDQVIVSVLTGNGLKDPDRAIAVSNSPIKVDSNKQAVLDILKQYIK